MKKSLFVMMAIVTLASCSKIEKNNDTQLSSTNTIVANIQPFIAEDGTKAAISTTGDFTWAAGDQLSVWPLTVAQGQTPAQIKFSIDESTAGTSSATFSGTGWGLITNGNYEYYSYFPYNNENDPEEVHITFPVQYKQAYEVNTSVQPYQIIIKTDHLSECVYMYAPSIKPDSPLAASFDYHQLGTLMHITFTLPEGIQTSYGNHFITISADAPVFVTEAKYNAKTTSAEQSPELTPISTTDIITFTAGYSGNFSFSAKKTINLYAIVCPAKLNGHTLTLRFYDYYGEICSATKDCTSDQSSGQMKSYSFGTLTKEASPAPTKTGVDLGTGVLWATTNIGAANPGDLGRKYAWGEKAERETGVFNESSAPFGPKTSTAPLYGYTKYNFVPKSTDPTSDEKKRLDLEDDIANIKWGDGWRMPTNAEIQALQNKCDFELTRMNGIPGYKVFNRNDHTKWIFLPYAQSSYMYNNDVSGGNYLSSELTQSDAAYEMIMSNTRTPHYWMSIRRLDGAFVRAVKDID